MKALAVNGRHEVGCAVRVNRGVGKVVGALFYCLIKSYDTAMSR